MSAGAVTGQYESYKRSTSTFMTWLGKKVPSAAKSVSKMIQSVKTVCEQNLPVPSDVFDALSEAIERRKEVHGMYTRMSGNLNTANRSHRVFFEALEYCQALLLPLYQKTNKGKKVESNLSSSHTNVVSPHRQEELKNMFEVLHVDDVHSEDTAMSDDKSTYVMEIQGLISKTELNGRLCMVEKFIPEKGRYMVTCDGASYALKSSNLREPKTISERENAMMGFTIEFEAVCLLVDIERILNKISKSWSDYRHERCSLLCATALTNAAVIHGERLLTQTEVDYPELKTIQRVHTAAYFIDAILWAQQLFDVNFDTALEIMCTVVHGSSTSSKLYKGAQMIAGVHHLFDVVRTGSPGHSFTSEILPRIMELASTSKAEANSFALNVLKMIQIRLIDLSAAKNDAGKIGFLNSADVFLGESGILYTADFLRGLAVSGLVAKPTVWSTPKPGFFGPPWDEATSPATDTDDLKDYIGGVLPALFDYASDEFRDHLPASLFIENLLPFVRMIRSGMESKTANSGMVFGCHALMLSVTQVNGNKRCARIQIMTRVALAKAGRQLDEGSELMKQETVAIRHNLSTAKSVVDYMEATTTTVPPGVAKTHLAAAALKQIENSFLFNPWSAGQQLLLLNLGIGISWGSGTMDSAGQLSFALHMYNAMRSVNIIDIIPLLETLLSATEGSKGIWFAGRPNRDFVKHWYHRLGMGTDTRGTAKSRKLVQVKAKDISLVYRRVCEHDFTDVVKSASSEDQLECILNSIQQAFKSDKLVGLNLMSLGAKLVDLGERLVDALALELIVQQELSQMDEAKTSIAKHLHRRDAIYNVLTDQIMWPCEHLVPKHEPLNWAKIDRKDLPPLTARQKHTLKLTAQTMVEYFKKLSSGTYSLV